MNQILKLAFAAALVTTSAPGLSQTADFSQAQVVEVDLSNFAFAPRDIHLTAGQPIILRLVNTGNGGHNFDAPIFFTMSSVRPSDMAAIHDGSVELHGHQTVEIGLVPTAGTFALKCSHPLHAAFGMTGSITVE